MSLYLISFNWNFEHNMLLFAISQNKNQKIFRNGNFQKKYMYSFSIFPRIFQLTFGQEDRECGYPKNQSLAGRLGGGGGRQFHKL